MFALKFSPEDNSDHQADIRTYIIFGFLGSYKNYTRHNSLASRNGSTIKQSFDNHTEKSET
jgi:hypothetical protein